MLKFIKEQFDLYGDGDYMFIEDSDPRYEEIANLIQIFDANYTVMRLGRGGKPFYYEERDRMIGLGSGDFSFKIVDASQEEKEVFEKFKFNLRMKKGLRYIASDSNWVKDFVDNFRMDCIQIGFEEGYQEDENGEMIERLVKPDKIEWDEDVKTLYLYIEGEKYDLRNDYSDDWYACSDECYETEFEDYIYNMGMDYDCDLA